MENELDVAKAVRDGARSPQRFGNMWLFDVRVTGTRASYRESLGEYVWRPPEIYLTDEFLERCQGLPVIFRHPDKSLLNTEEWRDRAIGTLILPYIPAQNDAYHRTDDVWAIARIYDGDAAELMQTTEVSTSPAVSLGKDNTRITTEDGTPLLIEGEPRILDHLAVCSAGVWDKGGQPRGIRLD